MGRLQGALPWIVIATCASVTGAIGWLDPSGIAEGALHDPARATPPSSAGRTPHYVAPSQLLESNAMLERAIDGLDAVASDGRHLSWGEISGGLPVVLVFIKSGCPCSIDFEPYFHRVEQVYRGFARFVGIIDAGVDGARRYATEQHVPYPVLADADKKIIRRFGAKNGCYVSVLTATGVIDGYWPGSSVEALHELGRRIAKLAGIEERPVDVTGMPNALTTGCHYGL